MSEHTKPVPAEALGISIQAQAGAAQIVFQTYVPQDTGPKELNALVDRLAKVAKRQQAMHELVDLRKNLKVSEDTLARMLEDRARIDALPAPAAAEGRRLPNRHQQEQLAAQRAQADANEKRYREIITEARRTIAETEAIIADVG